MSYTRYVYDVLINDLRLISFFSLWKKGFITCMCLIRWKQTWVFCDADWIREKLTPAEFPSHSMTSRWRMLLDEWREAEERVYIYRTVSDHLEENDMKQAWKRYETDLKTIWNGLENDMRQAWKRYETDLKTIWDRLVILIIG